MIQSNYYEDNPDIQMHVDRFIDWEEVVRLYEDGFRDAAAYERTGDERLAMAPHSTEEALDYYRSIFQAYGDLCGNEMSQLAQKMDQEGLKFESGTVTHPVLDGGKTWTLTLRRSDGSGEEVGFLRRDGSTHELRWYAHKDKVSSGSRVDSTSDTLEFRSYEHDASCTTWCGANQVDEPCGHTFPYCSNFHTCDDADDCQAHAAGCSLKNNYREIVSAKKN